MCTIVTLDQSTGCVEADGGIYQSYLTACANVTDASFGAAGEIDGFTMAGMGDWIKWVYDDDDSAYYNQEGERNNNKHVFNQTAFMKFAGLDQTKIALANSLKKCCCIVALHFANSGTVFVQGIEYDLDNTAWRFSKKNAKATVNLMTDTPDNEDRLEVSLISQGKFASPDCTLDATAIEAL